MGSKIMKYDAGADKDKNWIVAESTFISKFQGKCEATFSLGNGYIGARSATEESYVGQTRNTFVSGTFNRFDEKEVTELPNAADHFGISVIIDGVLFSLESGKIRSYDRRINLRTGILTRSFQWSSPSKKKFEFKFERFISKNALHFFASKMEVKCLNGHADVIIESGIDGQVTNSGVQHFHEGDKRIFDSEYLQLLSETTESKITFIHNTVHKVDLDGKDSGFHARFEMDRRQVFMIYTGRLENEQQLSFEKISNIHTTRDWDLGGRSIDVLRSESIESLKLVFKSGYDSLRKESVEAWKKYWGSHDILIETNSAFDQLAIRFAMYHLQVMTPAHDSRMGIGAKGLSGEGYKGHSFWDTELFILPFFTFSMPAVAKSLLIYRYETINGARKKAKENGYAGAMYPWESAWKDDGEVTPVWGSADIVTGKSTKIWSGFIEQHITSDVAFAVWQYYQVTGDADFMESYGYEILLDTGIFWASRFEWDKEKSAYHINGVIGPDEYKEHVNNNAFTNYTAHWCIENAISYAKYLKAEKPDIYERLRIPLKLDHYIPILKERLLKIFLPKPNKDFVIPQSDGFFELERVDLSKYKNQDHVGTIFLDYSLDQINQIQVCKQADVVMLMYLLENLFDENVKKANYDFYEPITLHDSSLSLSTHSILASDIGDAKLAYSMFQKAARIDLGPNMKTSDHGIHAASFGGIWQIIVCGFGGIRMLDGKLRIDPKLPPDVNHIQFPIYWKGNQLLIDVKPTKLTIMNKGKNDVRIWHSSESHTSKSGKKLKFSL